MASVFIVDTSTSTADLIAKELSGIDENIEVRTFANGLEAFRAVERDKPRLVILNIILPGMQGLYILERIKDTPSLSSRVKVLILSSRSRHEDRERALSLGADGFVSKPFKMNKLKLEIQRLL